MKQYFNLVKKYLKAQWKSVIVLIFILLSGIILQLVNPQMIRKFMDYASEGKSTKTLIVIAVMYIVISLVQQLISVGTTYICQNMGWRATNALREDLIEHCINLDMGFHKSKQIGEMIERVDGDVSMLFEFFSKLILDIASNILLAAGILIMLLIEDIRIFIVLSVYVVGAIVLLRWYQSKGTPLAAKAQEASGKYYGFLGEQLSNTEDIKSCGATQNSLYKYDKELNNLYRPRFKASMFQYKLWNMSTAIQAIGIVIGLSFGFYLWKKGSVTLGTVYLIFNYTILINGPLQQLRRKMGALQIAEGSIARISELFSIKSTIKDGDENLDDNKPLQVIIEDLDFEYEKGIRVLNDISIKIHANKILGILGKTGSGKTTLAKLLVKLYEPSGGNIIIGDKNLKDISLKSLREKVAYVTQDVHIFTGTLRDNLTLFNSEYSDDGIIKSMEEAGLKDWVNEFPEGLDTLLYKSGVGLSAGEAQLLAFARVFLKKPLLVILDEASSRLDPITEKAMEAAIDKLSSYSTCIIIAHRLSTIEKADDILILENGQIIEYGNRLSLVNDENSRYNTLIKTNIEEVLA